MAETASQANQRIGYIDLLKGIACLMILQSHSMRVNIGEVGFFTQLMMAFQPPSAQMFFFASGMNIVLLMEKYGKKKNFQLTPYYLISAFVLFALGYTYSFARLSVTTWQIFQGIAIATAFTYIFVRLGLSNRMMILLAAFFYVIYLFFRIPLEPVLSWMRVTMPVGAPGRNPEVLENLMLIVNSMGWIRRYLFINFSVFPWVSYTMLGAVAFRSVRQNARMIKYWAIAFAVMFVGGMALLWIPHGIQPKFWWFNQILDLAIRHIPHHVFTATGATGLIWLALHKWYKGIPGTTDKRKIWLYSYLEFLGANSFVFFCYHWILILGLRFTWAQMHAAGMVPEQMNIHVRWMTLFLLVLPLVRPVTNFGNWWAKKPFFLTQITFLSILSILTSLFYIIIKKFDVASFIAFGACMGYAYSYPVIRARLKNYFTLPVKVRKIAKA